MTGNHWTDMFEQPRQHGRASAPPLTVQSSDDDQDTPDYDVSIYRPWIVQRGRSRPPMMLEFRRYEPRSGLWSAWAIAYPMLLGLEYTGDCLLSLDFGSQKIVLEGYGLQDLSRQIQNGSVVAIQEYCQDFWNCDRTKPIIRKIKRFID